jgi:thiol-disulfide isomerase/thioredoxin
MAFENRRNFLSHRQLSQFRVVVFVLISFVFLSGCASMQTPLDEAKIQSQLSSGVNVSELVFFQSEFVDVDGNTFILSEVDKPFFIKTFAVWCSNCRKQSQEFDALHGVRDDFVAFSLNLDVNENTQTILEYKEKYIFSSSYVVAPDWLILGLSESFGPQILSPPSVPVVFVCRDRAIFLERGIKSAATLEKYLEACYAY